MLGGHDGDVGTNGAIVMLSRVSRSFNMRCRDQEHTAEPAANASLSKLQVGQAAHENLPSAHHGFAEEKHRESNDMGEGWPADTPASMQPELTGLLMKIMPVPAGWHSCWQQAQKLPCGTAQWLPGALTRVPWPGMLQVHCSGRL